MNDRGEGRMIAKRRNFVAEQPKVAEEETPSCATGRPKADKKGVKWVIKDGGDQEQSPKLQRIGHKNLIRQSKGTRMISSQEKNLLQKINTLIRERLSTRWNDDRNPD